MITMVNALLQALSEGHANDIIGKVLNNLIVYTRSHFEREEAEMRRIAYSGTMVHKAEHSKLLSEVLALKTRMDSGEKVNATSVYTFLSTWLRHHILEVDMKLAATLQHA